MNKNSVENIFLQCYSNIWFKLRIILYERILLINQTTDRASDWLIF
jgi:hypothetical protein